MICRIGDVFTLIRNGANIKQGADNSGYPITRIETISKCVVDRNRMGYAGIHEIGRYSDYILEDGDILMSHINSEMHLGKVALYEKQPGETIVHGMNLLCLRPKREILNCRYAFYALSSGSFLRQIPRITKKSVNQASFNVAALKELQILVPTIEQQVRIVGIFDKLLQISTQRQQQITAMEQLVKSRFVEMFGDPVSARRYERIQIAQTGRVGTGNTPSMRVAEYYGANDIPFIKPGDIDESGVTLLENTTSYIAEEARSAARIMPSNSVVVTCIGTIGKIGITIKESACNQQINYIIPADGIDAIYLAHCLCFFKAVFAEMANAPVVPIINKSQFSSVAIPIPPIGLQEQFAAFVEQTDKSKLCGEMEVAA